ncbi:hypothetical protein CK203_060945 [Vitis vinifera]|uniref:Uncharacterized protein n=1 Tax=Vitis vinifera TaxID=29760 RepID=A0A438GGQ6_VITVI|nr:hypothetical protein CK203_060945 [Vitis vinifera]
MAPKKTVSSVRVSEAGEKAIDKLNAKEFRERFRIPHDVLIDLVNEEAAIPLRKVEKTLSSSQRNNSTRGSGSLCQPCSRNSSTSLRFHPSSFIPTLSGKQRMISSVCPLTCLPSNGDRTARFDKGRGEGAGGSLGWMGGAIAASVEAFFSELYLTNPGPPCGLGGKASFACVCKLFEIDPKERAYKTLLSARNLTEVVREPQEYVINILPRKLAKDEIVPGEHYTVKELPLYQEAKEADAERRRKLLEDRDQKKTEGTIRKAPGQKRGPDSPPKKTSGKREAGEEAWEGHEGTHPPKEFPPPQTTYEGEVMIEEPVNAAPHSISSGPGRMSGLNHSGPSLVAARLANVAEEAASINRPGNLNPDVDAAETAPLEEEGAESQSQPSDDPDRLAIVQNPLKKPRLTRDLQSGLFERLQERQQEIEISCASAHDAHPDGGEVEMATETSAAPVEVEVEMARWATAFCRAFSLLAGTSSYPFILAAGWAAFLLLQVPSVPA